MVKYLVQAQEVYRRNRKKGNLGKLYNLFSWCPSLVPLHWRPNIGYTSPRGAGRAAEPPIVTPGTGSTAVPSTNAVCPTKRKTRKRKACTRSVYDAPNPGPPQSREFLRHKTVRPVRVANEGGRRLGHRVRRRRQNPTPDGVAKIYKHTASAIKRRKRTKPWTHYNRQTIPTQQGNVVFLIGTCTFMSLTALAASLVMAIAILIRFRNHSISRAHTAHNPDATPTK